MKSLLPEKMNYRWWPAALGLGYIALIAFMGGLRPDHLVIGSFSLLDYYNPRSRIFLKYFFPFVLTAAGYDFMRYFYWQAMARSTIYVSEPHFRDLKYFGIDLPTGRVTPNGFFQLYHWPAIDLLCGFAYLTFIYEYLGTGVYLFHKNNLKLLAGFGWCFFAVNIIGYSVYYIYPAAPPWYVTTYGFGPARLDVHSSAASAVRFDQILGTHFFDSVYGRGVDVYGAYPSLHVAYPFLVAWVVFQVPALKKFRVPSVLFYFLMCFSAVYLQHHYVVDIILGTGLAGLGAFITTRQLAKSKI